MRKRVIRHSRGGDRCHLSAQRCRQITICPLRWRAVAPKQLIIEISSLNARIRADSGVNYSQVSRAPSGYPNPLGNTRSSSRSASERHKFCPSISESSTCHPYDRISRWYPTYGTQTRDHCSGTQSARRASFVTCIRIVSSSPFRPVSSHCASRLSERIESLKRASTIRKVRLRDYAREKRRLPR